MASPPNPPRRLRYSADRHLRTTNQFQNVYREGNRARGALMTVAAVNNQLGFSRLGLSVGKLVWKSAVRRNRVRRLFREAFRLEQERLPVGVDLVLIGHKAIWPTLDQTRAELLHLAHKAVRRYLEKIEHESSLGSPSNAREPKGESP